MKGLKAHNQVDDAIASAHCFLKAIDYAPKSRKKLAVGTAAYRKQGESIVEVYSTEEVKILFEERSYPVFGVREVL